MTAQTLDILFVITKANWGGAQRYLYDLATALQAEGRTVAVAYGAPGLLAERLELAGIRTMRIPSMGRDVRAWRDLRSLFALVSLLRKERPRVLHLNSSKAGGIGALAGRLAGVPLVAFTAHGWAWNEDRSFLARIAIRALAWLTVMLAHKTICVSESMRRDGAWMPFSSSRFTVVHNGLRPPDLLERGAARKALMSGDASGQWIGMISELHPTKRVADAILAFALLSKQHADARLVVMGDGEKRKELAALIEERGLTERVFLLGFVDEAARHLRAFDAFLHASKSESFGYAVAEAGLAGLPVVATKVGAIPELVEDGASGTLVPLGDIERMAGALADYLAAPERAKAHGERLRVRMLRDFSVERMAEGTLRAYGL